MPPPCTHCIVHWVLGNPALRASKRVGRTCAVRAAAAGVRAVARRARGAAGGRVRLHRGRQLHQERPPQVRLSCFWRPPTAPPPLGLAPLLVAPTRRLHAAQQPSSSRDGACFVLPSQPPAVPPRCPAFRSRLALGRTCPWQAATLRLVAVLDLIPPIVPAGCRAPFASSRSARSSSATTGTARCVVRGGAAVQPGTPSGRARARQPPKAF